VIAPYPAPLRARAVVLNVDNVDTDQITPARFLRSTRRDGMAEVLFADWRARDPGFPLNDPVHEGAQVLVAGDNFGCGSSREHAPWALVGWGFRAIVSTSFADIFRSNSLKNGLLPIVVPPEAHGRLLAQLEADPGAELTVDLADTSLTLPDGARVPFPIDDFAQHCLLTGLDELGYLLSFDGAITAFESAT